MSIAPIFAADDFEKQPRGPRLFDRWLAKQPLENPIGCFDVVVYEPPDDELLRRVNELVTFASNEYDAIFNIVLEHYRRAAEDRYWMKGCGVPRGLREHRVARYLRSRSIVVRRDRNGRVIGTIFISPQWDIEHGIHLSVANGRLVDESA